ncbi:hypothetical protein BDA99DRAFT_499045 [Phascolomyces articulosus]|uniref:F-box domain-containing protein n=1 Tax=Phascolomyces articulosus TaxID=60185 RepID=A0AAD5PHW9_9FUNG|nr:hypothetical protein BDA99DRAFT_499045 [Phascolomyces articulosus]
MSDPKENQHSIKDNHQTFTMVQELACRSRFEEHSHNQNRFDIIAHIPLEIVSLIILAIDSVSDRFNLLDVSKTWRNVISECSSPWNEITINGSLVARRNKWRISLLPLINQHIIKLNLFKIKDNSLCESIYSQMAQGEFKKLEKLSIRECSTPSDPTIFYNALSATTALKHLDIKRDFDFMHNNVQERINISTILDHCSTLETLSFSGLSVPATVDVIINDTLSTNDSLTTLELFLYKISSYQIEHLLCKCTKLRRLTLSGVTHSTMGVITRLGTNLEFLNFNTTFNPKIYDDDINNNIQRNETQSLLTELVDLSSALSCTNTRKGRSIRHVGLSISSGEGDPIDFTSFFLKYSPSIRSMYLDMWSKKNDEFGESVGDEFDVGWRSLANASRFSDLRSLYIAPDEALCSMLAAPLIQSAPNLRWLTFSEYFVGQEFVSVIVHLDHLQRLEFNAYYISDIDIQALFRALATKQDSTLEEVSFRTVDEAGTYLSVNDILPFLPHISTLRQITFTCLLGEALGKRSLLQLCKDLRSHLNIRSIRLEELDCIDDEVLHHLARIKNIEHVHLEYLEGITRTGFTDAFENTSIQVSVEDCFY